MVREWFETFLIQRLGAVPAACTEETHFADLGLDSMDAVVMAGHLEDAVGRPIEPEVFLTHACLADVIVFLNRCGFLVQGEMD
jgi:phthiocerol/phenolphthiocerol synthesis type-I polyketide synthase B